MLNNKRKNNPERPAQPTIELSTEWWIVFVMLTALHNVCVGESFVYSSLVAIIRIKSYKFDIENIENRLL